MKQVNIITDKAISDVDKILSLIKEGKQEEVTLKGFVHKIRTMSEFSFVIIRTDREIVQTVLNKGTNDNFGDLTEGATVKITGNYKVDERAPLGFEIQITNLEVLSTPHDQMPLKINKRNFDATLNVKLDMRPISLRNPKDRAVFKIQEGIVRGFREFLLSQNFTDIRSPKIVCEGAEGGANMFELDYFGKPAYLAQSPQFYKQMMVGVFGRVFETGGVYRAEKHDTSRHINEFTGLDFEMGFIDSFENIMAMEASMLRYVFDLLNREYAKELAMFNITLPQFDTIPTITFKEGKEITTRLSKKKITDFNDFDADEEKIIGDYIKETTGSDLVFVTHYPSKKRPFYAMDDPTDPTVTLSFDLLLNGAEITTGGQRIHDYDMQVQKMLDRKMDPERFSDYLMIHKYGMPPHGGLGIGLERLTYKLLKLSNIREATLFPRDINRLTP